MVYNGCKLHAPLEKTQLTTDSEKVELNRKCWGKCVIKHWENRKQGEKDIILLVQNNQDDNFDLVFKKKMLYIITYIFTYI